MTVSSRSRSASSAHGATSASTAARSAIGSTATPASRRISRPSAWKVRTRTAPGATPSGATAASSRSVISTAARLLKVIARIASGGVPVAMSQAARATSVVVLPLPAGAMHSDGPGGAVAAARWSGARRASLASTSGCTRRTSSSTTGHSPARSSGALPGRTGKFRGRPARDDANPTVNAAMTTRYRSGLRRSVWLGATALDSRAATRRRASPMTARRGGATVTPVDSAVPAARPAAHAVRAAVLGRGRAGRRGANRHEDRASAAPRRPSCSPRTACAPT